MKRALKLNSDAWVDQYGDALFHFALARVNRRDIAEELVQETFLAAVQSQKRFKGQSSEKTWLFGILKHKVIDHFYQCLSGLPQRTADVFVYREIDGLSTDEICKLLGITSANCWVILYRARMLLRKCLELVGFGQKQKVFAK